MKPNIDKAGIFSMLIITGLITAIGSYIYFFVDWRNNSFLQDTSQRRAIPEFQEDSKIFGTRIVLRKDKSITVNKTRLVFKGLEKKMIHLDVFLLELDPESAYPRFISKADAQKGIRVGNSTFKLLKVNRKTLQLKLIDTYKT
ncbi:MAG: hypothetical protein D3926_12650 [Desulfobacteraceae bacterium]|nr:MAG: hypothetical protein D3926_12650 [Desulfobacteraceae bacterium]